MVKKLKTKFNSSVRTKFPSHSPKSDFIDLEEKVFKKLEKTFETLQNDNFYLISSHAKHGAFQLLKKILKEKNLWVEHEGITIFHVVAGIGDKELLEDIVTLYKRGLKGKIRSWVRNPLLKKDKQLFTPLDWAAEKGQLETFKYLIQSFNGKKTAAKISYLYSAIENHNLEFIKYLIEELDTDFDKYRDWLVEKLVTHAARGKGLEILKYFLEKGFDAETKGLDGKTLLHYAAKYAHYGEDHEGKVWKCEPYEILEFLVKEVKVNVNAQDDYGDTPLHYATNRKVAKILLDAGAEIDAVNKKGWTPLMSAISSRNFSVAYFLIDKGANVNHTAEDGYSVLHAIVEYGDSWDLSHILEKNLVDDLNVGEGSEWGTPLHVIARRAVRKYRDYKEKKRRSKEGQLFVPNPSEGFSLNDEIKMVELLAERGANMDAKDKEGKTPTEYIVEKFNGTLPWSIFRLVSRMEKFGASKLQYDMSYVD